MTPATWATPRRWATVTESAPTTTPSANTQAVNQGGGTGAGGTDTPSGNGNPVAPVSGAGGGQSAANGYPVGGVETGRGGLDDTLMPALAGSAGLVLIGAGAGSLLRGRMLRRKAPLITEA